MSKRLLLILFIVASIFFILLSYANWQISDSFYVLNIREIDDLAFQNTIRRMHKSIAEGHLFDGISSTDYGYGSLFWAVSAITTFPFYLVNNTQLVIFIPRLLSAIFALSGCALLSQAVLRSLTRDSVGNVSKTITVTVVISLLITSPAITYASLRFHNHTYIFFLECLSIYLANRARLLSFRNLFAIVIIQSLAISIKLSSLISILPLTLVLFDRGLIQLFSKLSRSKQVLTCVSLLLTFSAITMLALSPKYFFELPSLSGYSSILESISTASLNARSQIPVESYKANLNLAGVITHYPGIAVLIPLSLVFVFLLLSRPYRLPMRAITYDGLIIFSCLFVSLMLIFQIRQIPVGQSNYLLAVAPYFYYSLSRLIAYVIPGRLDYSYKRIIVFILVCLSSYSFAIGSASLTYAYLNQYNDGIRATKLKQYEYDKKCLKGQIEQFLSNHPHPHTIYKWLDTAIPCSSLDGTCNDSILWNQNSIDAAFSNLKPSELVIVPNDMVNYNVPNGIRAFSCSFHKIYFLNQ